MRTTISAVLATAVVAASLAGCGTAVDIPRRPTIAPTQATSSPAPSRTAEPDGVSADLESGASVLIVGDSFTAGLNATAAEKRWASIAAQTLGWEATIDGVSGTGFTNGVAEDGTPGADFTSRILAQAQRDVEYDAVVLQGGLNDALAEPATEAKNVRAAVGAAQRAWPDAHVLVFGPTAPGPTVEYRAILAAIRESASDAGAIFIDTDEPRPWINTGNADLFDSGDGVHPNDSGHAYLAARFVAAIEALGG